MNLEYKSNTHQNERKKTSRSDKKKHPHMLSVYTIIEQTEKTAIGHEKICRYVNIPLLHIKQKIYFMSLYSVCTINVPCYKGKWTLYVFFIFYFHFYLCYFSNMSTKKHEYAQHAMEYHKNICCYFLFCFRNIQTEFMNTVQLWLFNVLTQKCWTDVFLVNWWKQCFP